MGILPVGKFMSRVHVFPSEKSTAERLGCSGRSGECRPRAAGGTLGASESYALVTMLGGKDSEGTLG